MERSAIDQFHPNVPDVSIVIVSWNAKAYLLDCLESIGKQKGVKNTEVVVVDNASSDGTPEETASRFPAVKLVRNRTNHGFARANNIGIEQTRGRYIALINSDIILLPGCVEKLITFMDQHPEIGMLGPRIRNPDGTVQTSHRKFPTFSSFLCRTLAVDRLLLQGLTLRGHFFSDVSARDASNVEVLSGCFLMVRREAVERVGLLDESFFIYGEDIDWCKRFHLAGWDIVLYPRAEAIHHGGASSSNAPVRFFIEMQKADLQYWKKYHGILGWTFCRIMMFFHQVLRIVPRSVEYTLFPSHRSDAAHKIRRSLFCIRWLLHSRERDSEYLS